MEIRTLQYFLTVAREQNITHAARKLNISQPPLSRQLQQMEEELGGPLFIRGKRKIRLTEEGEYLARKAEELLNMASLTKEHILAMREEAVKGTLALGVTETCSVSVLPDIIPAFRERYPQINYDIWCGNSNDICHRVEQGINDIGILRKPFDSQNLESMALKKEPWIAVVSKENPLSVQASVSLETLCEEPLIIPSRQPLQEEIRRWLATSTKASQIICMYNQSASVLPLISEDLGVAICLQSVMQYSDNQRLAYVKIATSDEYISDLVMIRKRNQILPANAKAFWNFVGEYFSQIRQK